MLLTFSTPCSEDLFSPETIRRATLQLPSQYSQGIYSRLHLTQVWICLAFCFVTPTDILFTVNLHLSRRTHVPTALSDMPSSTSLPQPRLNVPSLNSLARRSLIAKSLFNLLASPSPLVRRVRVLQVEAKELPEVKEVAADQPAGVVAVLVVAVDVVLALAVE
jgi:hypothetical protein